MRALGQTAQAQAAPAGACVHGADPHLCPHCYLCSLFTKGHQPCVLAPIMARKLESSPHGREPATRPLPLQFAEFPDGQVSRAEAATRREADPHGTHHRARQGHLSGRRLGGAEIVER